MITREHIHFPLHNILALKHRLETMVTSAGICMFQRRKKQQKANTAYLSSYPAFPVEVG